MTFPAPGSKSALPGATPGAFQVVENEVQEGMHLGINFILILMAFWRPCFSAFWSASYGYLNFAIPPRVVTALLLGLLDGRL